jgi:DNA-binding transcriptional LysR family regulator
MIARDDLVMVVSVNHRWANLEKLNVDDLLAGKWVLREDGSGTRAAFVKALDALGIPVGRLNIALELPSNEQL